MRYITAVTHPKVRCSKSVRSGGSGCGGGGGVGEVGIDISEQVAHHSRHTGTHVFSGQTGEVPVEEKNTADVAWEAVLQPLRDVFLHKGSTDNILKKGILKPEIDRITPNRENEQVIGLLFTNPQNPQSYSVLKKNIVTLKYKAQKYPVSPFHLLLCTAVATIKCFKSMQRHCGAVFLDYYCRAANIFLMFQTITSGGRVSA